LIQTYWEQSVSDYLADTYRKPVEHKVFIPKTKTIILTELMPKRLNEVNEIRSKKRRSGRKAN
jgi:hypothetical protein